MLSASRWQVPVVFCASLVIGSFTGCVARQSDPPVIKGEYAPERMVARFNLDLTVHAAPDQQGRPVTGFADVDSLNVRYRCVQLQPVFSDVTRDDQKKWQYLGNTYEFVFEPGTDVLRFLDEYVATNRFIYVEPAGIYEAQGTAEQP